MGIVGVVLGTFAGSALAQAWAFTVLQHGDASTHAEAKGVSALRQGGFYDNGLSFPRVWMGTEASGVTLAQQSPTSGWQVRAVSDTQAVGNGYVTDAMGNNGHAAALLWNADGSQWTDLTPAGFVESEALAVAGGTGIGSGGQQVGNARDASTAPHPGLWSGTAASWVDLLPAGAVAGYCNGTDGTTQVGDVYLPDNSNPPALWHGTAESWVSLLPPGLGWAGGDVFAVSDGVQVGTVFNADYSTFHACKWSGTAASFVDLHVPGDDQTEAVSVSHGHIVGWAFNSTTGAFTGLYWRPDGSVVRLDSMLPPGYVGSFADAVWSDGSTVVRIVGSAYSEADQNTVAAMWTLPLVGGCCTGQSCAVAGPAACASGGGVFLGLTTCGPQTCCQAPIGSPLGGSGDCDGDLLVDACSTVASADDCNHNQVADSCETLSFTTESFDSGLGAFVANGSASIVNGTLQLTPPRDSQGGSIVRPALTTGPTLRVRAVFDFRLSDHSPEPADGFSFALLDAATHTTADVWGETGPGAGSVAVEFNTYANGPEGNNSMFILYNGEIVAGELNLPFTMTDGAWHRAVVDLTPDGRITVRLATQPGDAATIFDHVQIPGYTPFRALAGFGGRTGAAWSRQAVDNVRIGVNGPADANGDGVPDACACRADYNQSGQLNVQDIFDFLAGWFAGAPAADFNQNGATNIQDIFDFLGAWFGGC